MDYVWYLSYGSNMYRERFLCYIKGEQYKDCARPEQGCRDNTLPKDERSVRINNDLFFTKERSKWGEGGVAFVSRLKGEQANTFAKMYLITREQFEDVVKQENNIKVSQDIGIDYDLVNLEGEQLLFEDKWYGAVLKVNEVDGIPVYTFTLPEEPEYYVKPCDAYLKSIITGIKLSFGDISEEILQSFAGLGGIEEEYSVQELRGIIESMAVGKI